MKIKFKADRPWPWSYLRYYYLSVPNFVGGGRRGGGGEERRGERDARRLRIKGRPCVYSYHYNVKIKSTILYWVVCKVFGTYQYHAFNRRAYLLLNFCRIIEFWFQVNFTRKKIEFKLEFLLILMILKIIVIVKNNSLILEKIYIYVYIYKKKNNDDKTFINYLN